MSNTIKFITIKQIRNHDVTFIKIFDHVCAYVRLDNIPESELAYETFRKNNVFGIDTAHGWNLKQTYEEKIKDAEYQISALIDSYEART